ncbi:similar to mobilization protein MobD [Rivularia sp. IAM M-261]|nr:similar to mobilization protein MobD [Rivularia sp. IAM M-261]
MVAKTRQTTAKQTTAKHTAQSKCTGRLVLVTGDKGGTGKSVMARILLDTYRHRNINCIAYECDQSNPQLYRHYNQLPPGVQTLKLNQRGGADALQDDLGRFSPKVSLVDLPAGAAEYFEEIANDICLFENAQRMGYRITMVSVLGRVKDSVVQLKRLVDFCGAQVDYVVAKNLYWGSENKFIRYDNSKVRSTIAAYGGVELLLPELFDDIFDFIDSNDLTFRLALEHDALTVSNKSRIFGWIDKAETELTKAAVQLGLD